MSSSHIRTIRRAIGWILLQRRFRHDFRIALSITYRYRLHRGDVKRFRLGSRYQQFLRIVWRAKAIGPASEVALHELGGRHVLNVPEPRLAGHGQHLLRREETDERRATGARPLRGALKPGSYLGSARSSGSRNVMASVEAGASAATWRVL